MPHLYLLCRTRLLQDKCRTLLVNNVRPRNIKTEPHTMNKAPRMSCDNVRNREYIIGFTPVDPILFVDQHTPNADITGVKYSRHRSGDKRSDDASADDQTRVTILLEGGPWKQEMWTPTSQRITYTLQRPGDFIAWEPGYCHTWEALGDATMLTVSFRRRKAPSEAEQAMPSVGHKKAGGGGTHTE